MCLLCCSPGNPQKRCRGWGRMVGGRVGDRGGREYIRNELYGESTYPTILL